MKKQKRIHTISLILLGISALLMSSCSSSPENLKVIPKSTNIVSVIDVYSIIKKGKLYDIGELEFFKTFKKEIRNENKKIAEILGGVIEDPSKSGINFTTDLFAFYIDEANDEKFMSLAAEVNDKEKFATLISDLLSEVKIDFEIINEKNYAYTIIEDEVLFGWDDSKLVLLIAKNYASRKNLSLEIEALMELKEKEQITSNEAFNTFYENKKDVSLWLSTNMFEGDYFYKSLEKKVDFDMTNNYIASHLNFDDDHISLLTQFTPNSELKKLMEESNVWNNSFNTKLLNYFPKESFATTSISFNPMSYYQMIEQKEEFEMIQSGFEKMMGFDVKNVFETVKGSAVYSLFGFENLEYTYTGYDNVYNEEKYKTYNSRTGGYDYEGGYEYQKVEKTKNDLLPIMGLGIDINDDKIIKKLLNKIPESEVTKHSNYYEFKLGKKFPVYLAYNESICVITNDKKSITSFENGGYSADNLGDSAMSSDIADSNFYSFLNVDYEEYPKEIKKEFQENQSTKEKKVLKIWNDFAKSFELKQVDGNSFDIILNTKETGNNSLNTIITTIDDNYKLLMSL